MSRRKLAKVYLSKNGHYAVVGGISEVTLVNTKTSSSEVITLEHGVSQSSLSQSGNKIVTGESSAVSLIENDTVIQTIQLDIISLKFIRIAETGMILAVGSSDTKGAFLKKILPNQSFSAETVMLGNVEIIGMDIVDDASTAIFWGYKNKEKFIRLVDFGDSNTVVWKGEDLNFKPTFASLCNRSIVLHNGHTAVIIDQQQVRNQDIHPHQIDLGEGVTLMTTSPQCSYLIWTENENSVRKIIKYNVSTRKKETVGQLDKMLFHESLAVDEEGIIRYAGTEHPKEIKIAMLREEKLIEQFTKTVDLGVFKNRS